MVPTVSAPPRLGVPVPTPGFDPAAVVVGDPALDEQPARALAAPAPRAMAPPAMALRDRKLRRLISLSDDDTTIPQAFPPAER